MLIVLHFALSGANLKGKSGPEKQKDLRPVLSCLRYYVIFLDQPRGLVVRVSAY